MGCTESTSDAGTVQLRTVVSSYGGGHRCSEGGGKGGIFTKTQATALLRSWAIVARRKDEVGRTIFAAIFAERPAFKQYFSFSDLEGEQLHADPSYRAHAANFMLAIEGAMEHIDSLAIDYAPVLINLGHLHRHKVKADAEIAGEAFQTFTRAVFTTIKTELGSSFTPEVEQAWTILFAFFRTQLVKGYFAEDAHSK
jgi:hemoglobin-like flavoprotein